MEDAQREGKSETSQYRIKKVKKRPRSNKRTVELQTDRYI
jgi:hypothetical protein